MNFWTIPVELSGNRIITEKLSNPPKQGQHPALIRVGRSKNEFTASKVSIWQGGTIHFNAPEACAAARELKEAATEKNSRLLLTRFSDASYHLHLSPDKFRFIDLFAGIGGMRLGFEACGGECVFSSEWDEKAQITYEANFGDKPHGDITLVTPKEIPDHDILLAGFPCQPFSIIGKRKGFSDTRGTLFFNIQEIIAEKQPNAFLLENVKQFKSHDNGRTSAIVMENLKELGYNTHLTVLNALDFGVPQKRERIFIVGFKDNFEFEFPRALPERAQLSDFLEPDNSISSSLLGTEYIRNKRIERAKAQGAKIMKPSIWHENKGGHLGIHPYSCALRHNASHNYLMVNGERRLSGRECLRLQGFPDTYRITVSHRDIRAQAGNAVAVPVIRAIAIEMLNSLAIQQPAHEPALLF